MPRNNSQWNPCSTIWADTLESHLQYLKKSDIKVLSMPQAIDILAGKKVYNKRMVCITFDDGFRNNLTVAWPIIKSYGYNAHFFITADAIGKHEAYNWDSWIRGTQVSNTPNVVPDDALPLSGEEIGTLVSEGATIGSHGMYHRDLTKLSEGELLKDVCESQKKIQDLTGNKVDTFAYPFGYFSLKVIKTLQASNYLWGFSVKVGRNVPGLGLNCYKINRFSFITDLPLSQFKIINSGGYDFIRLKDYFLSK